MPNQNSEPIDPNPMFANPMAAVAMAINPLHPRNPDPHPGTRPVRQRELNGGVAVTILDENARRLTIPAEAENVPRRGVLSF